MTKTEMMTAYNARSAAHVYALGFVHMNRLYAKKLSFEELSQYFKLDRASSKRGGFLKIRIKLTAKDRAELSEFFKLDRASSKRGGFLKIRIKLTSADRAKLSATAELIGTADLLEKDTAHNKGENFERELTERWTAETWVKDSIPFNVAGDIVVNGENVQVKLDGAELTNEKILARLGA